MTKKTTLILLIFVFILLFLVVLRLINFSKPVTTNPFQADKVTTTGSFTDGSGKNTGLGFVQKSDDNTLAITIGNLKNLDKKNNTITGDVVFQNSNREQNIETITFYNQGLPMHMKYQKSYDIYPVSADYSDKLFRDVDSAFQALKELEGKDIILTFYLPPSNSINKSLLECNSRLIDKLSSSLSTQLNCTPLVGQISAHAK